MKKQTVAILAACVVALMLEMTNFGILTYAYRASHNVVKDLVAHFRKDLPQNDASHYQTYGAAPALAADASVEVRKAAIHAIADSNTEQAVNALRDVFQASDEIEIRKAVVYALEDIDGDLAFRTLVDILASNADTEVRKAALYALSDREEPQVLDILIRTAKNTSEREVAIAAVYQLGDFDKAGEGASALAVVLSESPLSDIRKAAVYALEDVEADVAIPILKQVLAEDGSVEVRKAAAYTLGDIASEEASKALVDATKAR